MPNLSHLIAHWGHAAIFIGLLLGNIGVPVPEETIIGLAGYLARHPWLRVSVVMTVSILSAVTGDNVRYWLGCKAAIDRESVSAVLSIAELFPD